MTLKLYHTERLVRYLFLFTSSHIYCNPTMFEIKFTEKGLKNLMNYAILFIVNSLSWTDGKVAQYDRTTDG